MSAHSGPVPNLAGSEQPHEDQDDDDQRDYAAADVHASTPFVCRRCPRSDVRESPHPGRNRLRGGTVSGLGFHQFAILVVIPGESDDEGARLIEVPVVARPGDAATCARLTVFASLLGVPPDDDESGAEAA
jgi:hypothetical protein